MQRFEFRRHTPFKGAQFETWRLPLMAESANTAEVEGTSIPVLVAPSTDATFAVVPKNTIELIRSPVFGFGTVTHFGVVPGKRYVLEESKDLLNWRFLFGVAPESFTYTPPGMAPGSIRDGNMKFQRLVPQ